MIRRLPILLACAAVVAAACPSSASAGTYVVKACHSSISHSWEIFAPDAYSVAYARCPGDVVGNEGMVARNTAGPETAPYFSHARMFFHAPPGARIVRVTGQMNQSSTGGWLGGLYDETNNRWVWCGPSCLSSYGYWLNFDVELSTSRISALAMCAASTCARDGRHGYAAIRKVDVVVAEDGAPHVAIKGGGLVAAGWRSGNQDLLIERSDPVGVRVTRVSIDGRELRAVTHACDETKKVPCDNRSDAVVLDTRQAGDGGHTLRVRAIDSAGNSRDVHRTVWIDNHAPAPPSALSVDDGTGWRSGPAFALRWANPKESAAPIAGAFLQLCPANLSSRCQPARSLGRVTTAAVTVPHAGQWRARVWLKDAAGNSSHTNASERLLRVDDKAPALAVEPPTADRPALVRVRASDDASGLGAREILVRRRGSAAWIPQSVVSLPGGFGGVIDDERLRAGVYELRARATDAAGNERSTDRFANGTKAELALPLRVKTTLRVGRPTRVRARGARGKRRYRIKLVRSPRTGYGRTIPLRGRLTSPGGNPLAGRDVHVYEQTKLIAAPWRLIATVRTSRAGRFTFKALRGPSRTLRFRFGGSDTIRGRTADVRLGVRAAVSIRADRTRVVNGEAVTFRGQLRGRRPPSTGKLIELQAYARGRWLTFKTVRAHPASGRWSYTYRFSATRGNVRYRFRARVPREAGYPFETGVSRAIEVTVRGL